MRTGVENRRPCVQITPRDVIAYCKHRDQQPTLEQAEYWLSKNRKQIESEMRSVIKKEMYYILDAVRLGQYVDPALNEQFLCVRDAVESAIEEQEARGGGEWLSSSSRSKHMNQTVEHLLHNPTVSRICMEYEVEVTEAGCALPIRTNRVHLIRDQGKLRAELVDESSCAHADFLVIVGESSPSSDR